MAEKTFAQLTAQTDVQDTDLLGIYRGAGPLKKITASDLKTYLTAGLATGFLVAASNLSDLANAGTARTNLGLGSAAVQAASAFLQTANNLSDVTASTARTNLGLVVGTNVQAYDADLAAIAALVSAADRVPYATGSGTWALATFTSAGRALVDDADAAAQRTTLGLGSLATASTINNANWSGTVLSVANGGTGAATAALARTALGLAIGTDVQAFNANLAAFAGLSLVADTLPYGNGTGTLALATLTSAGRALIDDASASAQRTTLGLVIGTDVQAYDAGLLSIAGLTTAANKSIYTTALDTYATYDLTAFARTILDDADAATARTTLGIGLTLFAAAYATISGTVLTSRVAQGGTLSRNSTGSFSLTLSPVGSSSNNLVVVPAVASGAPSAGLQWTVTQENASASVIDFNVKSQNGTAAPVAADPTSIHVLVYQA